MRICYVCQFFVDADHECEVAKRLASNPTELSDGGPYLTAKAIPTRTGPDQWGGCG